MIYCRDCGKVISPLRSTSDLDTRCNNCRIVRYQNYWHGPYDFEYWRWVDEHEDSLRTFVAGTR